MFLKVKFCAPKQSPFMRGARLYGGGVCYFDAEMILVATMFAWQAICKTTRTAHTLRSDQNKPMLSFLFRGNTT